jgi:uncharacterized glyoxalase superfamily protein PhnB
VEDNMRKILAVFMFAFLLVGVTTVVKAEDTQVLAVEQLIDHTNEKIDHVIAHAQRKADEAMVKYADDDSRREAELDKIEAKLLIKTERMTQKAIEQGEKYGVELECYYIMITLGDRIVEVDPIRVHAW